MGKHPAPEPNWGKDNSSLVLAEQNKALPEAMKKEAEEAPNAKVDERIKTATGKTQAELLHLLTDAETQGRTFLQTYVNPSRERTYKAFRNEHFSGSKYLSPRFKTRSKLFKPKTRNAVRKAQSAAAQALFGSADVVSLTPTDDSQPIQRASAEVKQELLNYRLESTHGRDSIPWFLVSMGAHQDALLASVCVSKQYWKYRERKRPLGEENRPPLPTDIIFDRPDCLNIAPENVIIDPNCEWTRPAQTSPYLIVRYPMFVGEIMAMMRKTGIQSEPKWIPQTEEELLRLSGMSPQDVDAVRNARSGGADGQTGKELTGQYRILWVYENFLHIDGEDFCFWSIGNQKVLSFPRPTFLCYPEFFGERPYVIGLGALETHRPIPMSPAESWQQLQQEANDVTNLRLDQMKQVVTPVTKVRRGRQVDIEQVMRRGQDTVVMLTDLEDVEFDRPPDVPPSAMAESNILNNDFDELAGTFSQGSIQSNRSLNETVGGMKMLQGGANAITEFDLRVWVETWVEPVLNQLVRLEEYYENDAKILAIAGQKAQLVARYGIDEITDHFLMYGCTVRVAAGIGAADPMQQLEKLGAAAKISHEILMPFVEMGTLPPVTVKPDEIINEVWGKAGFKGAFDRFFGQAPPQQAKEDPKVTIEKMRLEHQAKLAADANQLKAIIEDDKLSDKERERQFKAYLAKLQASLDMQKQAQQNEFAAEQTDRQIMVDAHHRDMDDARDDRRAQEDREFQRTNAQEDRAFQWVSGERDREFQGSQKAQDRHFQAATGEQERGFQAAEKDKDRQHQRREGLSQRAFQGAEADAGRQHQALESDANRRAQGANADAERRFKGAEGDKARKHQTVLSKMNAQAREKQAAKKPQPKKKAA
jgi:hypothetical protein